jgi:hypothetical protein
MFVVYYGIVHLEYWEYLVLFFYLILVYLYFARQKNLMIRKRPEYRWFIPGLFAKLIGAVFFSFIYFYYYEGGDTTAYFFSSVALSKLAFVDPMAFFKVWLGENTLQARDVFTEATGKPYTYVFLDDRQYMVVRLVTPFTILCLNSFLVTTVVFASMSYIGIWRLYITFFRYFPRLHRELAIAVLLMPSAVMWGSSILKDTVTFSSFCWFIHALDKFWFRKMDRLSSIFTMVVSSLLIIWIKPYIFMVMVPMCGVWISYARVARIQNAAIKYLALPVVMTGLTAGVLALLTALGDQLGQFSLQLALDNIIATQKDLVENSEYGTNRFDVGELQPTWSSVFSKFPIATTASLFRPFITECTNFVMVLAGLENLFVLSVFIRMLIKTRIVFIGSAIAGNPLILSCVIFTLLYGFVTGITTPNFGALVRFKIPLMPTFMGAMYMVMFLLKERDRLRARGLPFRFEAFRNGDPFVKRSPDGMPML